MPLVKIMLRNGLAYDSFTEFAKQAYVKVAFDEFAPEGKKQTISRVSALTGLTRKEVKRLHELPDGEEITVRQRYNRATRVISGWVNDARFAGQNLYLDATEPSFSQLVKDYSGDIPTRAMLSTLEKAGTVKVEDNRIKLLQQAYIPGNDSVEKLNILGVDVAEIIDTINHNLEHSDHPYFQRKVSSELIPERHLDEFRRMMADKSMRLLKEFDAWMVTHETDVKQTETDGHQLSVGIYYYQSPIRSKTE